MSERSNHNEGQEPSMRDVRGVLAALREGSTENPGVLAIEAYEIMKALNKGFPKHMYHATLDPAVAIDKQDVNGLLELGYVEHYIPRAFPCFVYRRNFHPRFRLQLHEKTGLPVDPAQLEFIESRIVKDASEMKRLLKEPAPLMPAGIPKPGEWLQSVADIPVIEADTDEDLALQNARLQGQLEEARSKAKPN